MSSGGLNVIGLISGGKDSLYSLLHCIANGHKIVALANVYPPEASCPDGTEDLDSYMYQTVGHRILPLYSQALDLPLYREPIRGSAVNSRRDYKPPRSASEAEDETESLIPLLARVKDAHPEANAVSTGAILSTYQRTRVESVALRMGLIPLSFLWQFPYLPPHRQVSLLEDMFAAGQRSIIIKVASGGLNSSILGQNVADPKVISRLISVMSRFGHHEVGNVLGEGGEYETMVEEGPSPLWKGKIVSHEQQVMEGEGDIAVLNLNGGLVIPKEPIREDKPYATPRKPDLLDSEFQEVLEKLFISKLRPTEDCTTRTVGTTIGLLKPLPQVNMVIKLLPGEVIRISNLHCVRPGLTAGEQMRDIVSTLRILLGVRWSLNPISIVFSSITLRMMADFGEVNVVYASLFRDPNPPARVTIACGDLLPDNVDVVLSVIVDLGSTDRRRGLHVQSRSYWAPANIGPYSQAIAVPFDSKEKLKDDEGEIQQFIHTPQIVHVAGQIPLVPSSMELISAEQYPVERLKANQQQISKFGLQAVLALQHLWRIGRSMDVAWWSGAIAFITDCPSIEAEERAAMTFRAWANIHLKQLNRIEESAEDIADFDIWHTKNNVNFAGKVSTGDVRRPLPNPTAVHSRSDPSSAPPSFTVQVQELPRGASIEWLSTGIGAVEAGGIEQQCVFQTDLILHCCRILPDGPVISFIGLHKAASIANCTEHLLSWIPHGQIVATEWIHFFTVYIVTAAGEISWSWLEEQKAEVIPCLRIWHDEETRLEALIVVHTRRNDRGAMKS